jgi:lysophospholipase L1-like esterase
MPAGAVFIHNTVYWVEPANQTLESVPHKETGGSFRVSTDQNGLRAPLHPEKKPEGAFRVMTLGCSTTFGWGVDDAAAYPDRLEAILNESGHPVQVINGGQPGYTSLQGLHLWDTVLHRYAPDVVLFGYLVQDSREVAYSDRSQQLLQQDHEFIKESLLHQLKSYLWIKATIDGVRTEAKEVGSPDTFRIPREEYVENIRAFKARTEAVGAELVLFAYPLERSGYTEGHRALLHAAATELNVPIYDPQPEMERRTASEPLYFPQDRGHANAAGNEVIAQGVAQFLVASGLVK